MKKLAPGLLAGTAALALSITVLQPAEANPAIRSSHEGSGAVKSKRDNRPGPLTKQQNRLKTKALTMLDNGSAQLKAQSGGGSTVQLADGSFVEFPIAKEDKVFTILSEFGDQSSGRYGTVPNAGFGLGFERLVVYVCGLGNIRDAIPYPRAPGSAEF